MGKNRKKHAAKVLARNQRLRGQVSNTAVQYLQHQSTNNQVKFLSDSLAEGRLSVGKLRNVLQSKAVNEMNKGIDKLLKKKKTPTVDLLLEEYHREHDFQRLATKVGLDESWFIWLARTECEKRGISI